MKGDHWWIEVLKQQNIKNDGNFICSSSLSFKTFLIIHSLHYKTGFPILVKIYLLLAMPKNRSHGGVFFSKEHYYLHNINIRKNFNIHII